VKEEVTGEGISQTVRLVKEKSDFGGKFQTDQGKSQTVEANVCFVKINLTL
jgi:hypothetical protein